MIKKDTKEQFSPLTITLHWLIALTIIGLLGIGIYMSNTHTYSLYPIHKSIGTIIFIFILARIIWRIINGWPQEASQYKKVEIILAKIVHYILLIGSILIPLSGLTMSIMGGHGVDVFGFELFARNTNPDDTTQTIPYNRSIAIIANQAHAYISYTVIIALFLHITGAFKHHFIDKDGTLRRMLGQKISA